MLALLALAPAALVLTPQEARAQVTVERRAAIMMRALAYDRKLGERVGDAVNVLIVFKKGDAASERSADEWAEALQGMAGLAVQGKALAVSRAAWNEAAVQALVQQSSGDVLLVCEGLTDAVPQLTALSHAQKVVTVGVTRTAVEKGLSLGVVAENERTVIVINLPASKAEGVVFASDVLKLAQIVE